MTNEKFSFLKSTFKHSHLAGSIAIVAIIANAGMDIATKLVASDISAWQGVFLRWGYASCILLLIEFFNKRKDSSPSNRKVHTLRLGLNLIGSAALFFALSTLDLWLTLTIFFMEPVFTVIFAALFLGEVFGIKKVLSIILCLVGVAVVLLPQSNDSTLNYYAVGIAFLGTIAWGVMHLVTQHYGKDQSTARLILYLAIFTTIASAAPAIATWQSISLNQHAILAVVAILGTIYSYLWIIALKLSSAAGVSLFAYLILPIGMAAGWIFFDERIVASDILGSSIIVCAVFLSSTLTIKKLWPKSFVLRKKK